MLLPIALETAQSPLGNNRPQEETAGILVLEEFEAVLASMRFETQDDQKTARIETNSEGEQPDPDGQKESLDESHQEAAIEPIDTLGVDEEFRELSKILSDAVQAVDSMRAKASDFVLPEDQEEPSRLFSGAEDESAQTQVAREGEQKPALPEALSQPGFDGAEQDAQRQAQGGLAGSPVVPIPAHSEQVIALGPSQTNGMQVPTNLEKRPNQSLQQASSSSPGEAARTNTLGALSEEPPESTRDIVSLRGEERGRSTDTRGFASKAAPDQFVQTPGPPSERRLAEAADGLRRDPLAINGLRDGESHERLPHIFRGEFSNMTEVSAGSPQGMAFAGDKAASSVLPFAASEIVGEALENRLKGDGLMLSDKSFLPPKETVLQARMAGFTPALSPDHSASAMRQVADVVRITPGGVVDISLRPDELGAVRLSMKAVEGQMTVIVQADRSDTLDLMRRNIEGLSQEFKELGYSSVAFSFQSGGDDRNAQKQGHGFAAGGGEDAHLTNRAEDERVLLVASGLDIRI